MDKFDIITAVAIKRILGKEVTPKRQEESREEYLDRTIKGIVDPPSQADIDAFHACSCADDYSAIGAGSSDIAKALVCSYELLQLGLNELFKAVTTAIGTATTGITIDQHRELYCQAKI